MLGMKTGMAYQAAKAPVLLHEIPARAAACWPEGAALTLSEQRLSYAALQTSIEHFASGLLGLGLARGERVAVYLEKRVETVVALFGVPAAASVVVPVNPLLKPLQVAHILQDCAVQVLVTSPARWAGLVAVLGHCPALCHVVLCESTDTAVPAAGVTLHTWNDWLAALPQRAPLVPDNDVAAIFYTSGSTGKPKGVVLSHRNLVAGAASVASYLENTPDDCLLAALPLSFDAGFSQLTTGFLAGARVVLLNYLLPRDVLNTMAREAVTGLTAVPPLYMQLTAQDWPEGASRHLRYWANTGGRLPRATLERLQAAAPQARPFLMYGLTEAFRSTFLPPDQVSQRPDSIGRAIPNAEILVLREDGSACAVDESGELVHRGPLVAQGYWNRPAETAQRFRPLPAALRPAGVGAMLPELAVFSGDTVRRDADGFLYFVGRRDEMIKTSGYRVSPTEIEEALYASGLVQEAVAYGVPHEVLGSAIQVRVFGSELASGQADADTAQLLRHCRETLPGYMVPSQVEWAQEPLPRNANGKLDRQHGRAKHGPV